MRPWVGDRRRLGVRIGALTVTAGSMVQCIPLDSADLSAGWWDVEVDGGAMRRWTDGDAILPVWVSEPCLLEIMLAGTLDYPLGADSVCGRVAA
jgi:hypothetical protein